MSSDPAPTKPPGASTEQTAGRGLLVITAAKVWFLLGASILNFALPYLLPSKVSYGEWGFVLSVVSPLNNVMITATLQAVARFAARGPGWVGPTQRSALGLQLVVGLGVGAIYFAAAPTIAAFFADPGLATALRISTGVVVAYAFYAVFVGVANGTRAFQQQAGLDATFTTLRTVLVCGGAVAAHSVLGAVTGFSAAAATVLGIAVVVVGLRPARAGDERVAAADLVRFMLPVAAYLAVTNALMFVDGWAVKKFIGEWAAAASAADPAKVGSEAAGIYTICQTIARIPYQAVIAVNVVIFPLVSAATFASDHARTRAYIDRSLRLSFLVVMAMAAGVAARPAGILSLLPRNEYLPGGHALAVLVYGYVAFSLLTITGSILNGAGRTVATTLLAAGTLAFDLGLTWVLVHAALDQGRDPLLAAALATTVAMASGLAASLAFLHRAYGASLRPASIARAAIATACAIAVGHALPLRGKAQLAACVAGGLVYVAALFVLRELTPAELRGLLRRGAPDPEVAAPPTAR